MSELLSTLHLCLFSRTFNVIGKVLKTPYKRSRRGRDRMVQLQLHMQSCLRL
jgi:hypothetical protein